MKNGGHKTKSIYRRDIADGPRKVAAFEKLVARSASEGQSGALAAPQTLATC
jgi:hypothetical protein